ncbi:hypothetical protein E2562_031416 [Oryza meyeriana var. granulata]|uniref:Uncharacterized protein n=1 Tax=Oryza meyeriana var. granulata TaxID=110450 RepID=A0A6G1C1J1_9ORYZ|nr:hypothetical protein E2562_031416 [Oryza meyeriana var. granulata]
MPRRREDLRATLAPSLPHPPWPEILPVSPACTRATAYATRTVPSPSPAISAYTARVKPCRPGRMPHHPNDIRALSIACMATNPTTPCVASPRPPVPAANLVDELVPMLTRART